MLEPPKIMESISLRRAKLVDADKVRYRVYNSPTEFIAVIAENALMAVKVSGIAKPHKIVRDLPSAGVAIEAQKMAVIEDLTERVTLSSQLLTELPGVLQTEMSDAIVIAKEALFKPISLSELQQKGLARARILSPEMLNAIIEEHVKAAMQLSVEAAPGDVQAISGEMALDAMMQALPLSSEQTEAVEPQLATPKVESASKNELVLSPEEVEKLLHG